jgi:hypothetical protein
MGQNLYAVLEVTAADAASFNLVPARDLGVGNDLPKR